MVLEDELEARALALWRKFRERNRMAGVTHYELVFVVNEDSTDLHVRNSQKDVAKHDPNSLRDIMNALGAEPVRSG
ncbi:MAG: hypothetical protein M1546_16280 [Chloroflexi bacterium]|nr:hypothetical protein [Chloroflexota bacterium]